MKKLNMKGFSHEVLLVFIVVIFAIIGVGYLVASHAAGPSSIAPELHLPNPHAAKGFGIALAHDPNHPISFAKPSGGGGKGSHGGSTGGGGSVTSSFGSGPLYYHGGGMFMNPYNVYNIYWVPAGTSVASGYQSTIDTFIKNVAHDSGQTTNVFYAATQYTNSSGTHAVYAANFGGSAVVTDPMPASGCTDTVAPSDICLNDSQVQTEINTATAANGWSITYPNMFVLYTPANVQLCTDGTTYCTFSNACAWHHQWGNLSLVIQPYVSSYPGCQTGQAPNGNTAADASVNTLSHEINESVTDPAAGSWYDTSGYENGDKCAWLFGNALGGTTGAFYNQVINGAHYWLQEEYSNASSKCVQTGV